MSGIELDLAAIEQRAKRRWLHVITGEIDLDIAYNDVMSCVGEALEMRARLAAILTGLGVQVADGAFEKEPGVWIQLGLSIGETMFKAAREAAVDMESDDVRNTEKAFKTADEFNALVGLIKSNDPRHLNLMVGLCARYYGHPHGGCGGNLHVVLDDGNLENAHLHWCGGFATGCKDQLGADICSLMLHMSKRQRVALYESYSEYQ